MDDCSSRPLFHSYLKGMIKCRRIPIIYNRYIFITQYSIDNDYTAITVLHLPKEYYSTVKSLQKTKKELK